MTVKAPTTLTDSLTSCEDSVMSFHTMQLEAFAEEMAERLEQSKLVQDRQTGDRFFDQSFTGKDAVTTLQKVLQDENCGVEVSRDEALQVGIEIATEFNFFAQANAKQSRSSATTPLLLEDSAHHFYKYQDNLPTQVHKMKKKYPSMWDNARLLQSNIKLGKHSSKVRVFKDSFLAKHAVDSLVTLKLARTRREAIHVMRKINDKVECCRHVTLAELKFADNDQILRFVPVEQQQVKPVRVKASRTVSAPARSTKSVRHFKDLPVVGGMKDTSLKSLHSDASPKSKSSAAGTVKTSPSEASRRRKDTAYFKERATDIRSRMNAFRDTTTTTTTRPSTAAIGA